MNLQKMRVLIVDDARVAREILKNLLKEIGITQVVFASSGNEAVETLKTEKVDMILSDWNMPGMSGLDLLKKVRGDNTLAGLPVIMGTAERMDQTIILAVQEGVTAYIKKPFGAQELQKKIRQALHLE